MKTIGRIVLVLLGLVLLVLLIGPFLVPVPPLEDTVPIEELAGEDSRFADVAGVTLHYKEAGQGDRVLILLHGFGASVYSWQQVMDSLAAGARVIAYDRPAFGLTERPMPGEWSGQNPYSPEAQVDQLLGLMDELGVEQAVLVGNSAGGTVAMQAALEHPQRVEALILVDAAVYGGGERFPAWTKPLLRTPQARRLGALLVRSIQEWGEKTIYEAWHDPSGVTEEVLAGYKTPLRAENWDRALWEQSVASHSLGLADRLDEIQTPVMVITGDDDRIVPLASSLRLASELPGSELVVLPACGHVPQEECPQAFLEAVTAFLER